MTHPVDQILDFPDADFVDRFLRSTMTVPYANSIESPRRDQEGTNFIICYVQRSGSTHLTSLLQNTGLAGKPADYLNAAYAGLPLENRQVAQRTGAVTIVDAVREYGVQSVSEYLEKLAKLTRTPNGVFGLKVDLAHASSLLRSGLFFDPGWNWKYIFLTRRDLLRQAISYYTAMRTGLWSSISASDRSANYDQQLITEYMLTLSNFMSRWECIFRLFDIEPTRIQYEEIEADPTAVLRQCFDALAIGSDLTRLPIVSDYSKQRSSAADEWSAAITRSSREYRVRNTTIRLGEGAQSIAKSVSGESAVWAPQLADLHVRNCRVFPSREELISTMPRKAVCAEVGVQTGYFSAQILNRTVPRTLHLLDLDISQIRYDRFPELLSAVDSGSVILHQGASARLLSTFPDSCFDWIYIDGDHSYGGVILDIAQALRVIRPEGLIVLNDYVKYSPLELVEYGVMEAVNELCLDRSFEMVGLALHGLGYFDVALRKMRLDSERDPDTVVQKS
jgi:LPS sulfotransferase NodH/SAM-dependent methyltransferase